MSCSCVCVFIGGVGGKAESWGLLFTLTLADLLTLLLYTLYRKSVSLSHALVVKLENEVKYDSGVLSNEVSL